MERRRLGRTGLMVSVLGYGCGAVGGLMVRGTAADQERAIARALENGINYFDTAASYGDGESERNLGRVLKTLKPAETLVGTKVRLAATDRARIAEAVAASLEASLKRLGRDSVDLFQLHNPITVEGREPTLSPEVVLGEVVPAFERLRAQGKTRFFGITAIGDATVLRRVVGAGAIDTAQVPYNLLNPSATEPLPQGFPAHDFDRLMLHAQASDVGVIGIRILAGGALSGEEARHPTGMPSVEPIASGPSYAADVEHARRLAPLVAEGQAGSLVEAALRFATTTPAMGTALVGTSTLEQLESALAAVAKGPLPAAALARLSALRQEIASAR
jgi:aryl-alcohol dehydrogenase-like predicted oxidoreductase